MTQYNTDRFFLLRKLVAAELPGGAEASAPPLPPEIGQTLRECRQMAQQSQGAFREAGSRVWETLAKLEEKHPFALPPCYETDFIRTEFAHAMDVLHSLNKLDKAPGDHRIFHGLKGTGKTMFLHVVGAVGACLLETTLPIYWTYENSDAEPPSPKQLAQAVERLVRLEQPEKSFEEHVIDVKNEEQSTVHDCPLLLLLLDEFTTLYYPPGEKGQKIMGELVSLSKQRNTVILLAASHHDIRKYVHPTNYGTYPDLNNSVFFSRPILPLRDRTKIQAYFMRRYNMELSMEEAADAFYRTGGVGHWMANWRNSREFKPGSCLSKIMADNRLFRLCTHMVSKPGGTGITYNDAVRLLDDPQLLEQYCDQMIFVREGSRVDFVCPAIADEFRSLGRKRLVSL